MIEKFSFPRVVAAVVILMVIIGVALFVLLGGTTNKGTTGSIGAEYAKIAAAEKMSCDQHGHYASLTALEQEGLLRFKPIYNSVVYLPGKGCGSIVVGSSAYQSTGK